jgi:hypothetical protein
MARTFEAMSMPTTNHTERTRLSIEIDVDLRHRLRGAAARHDLSVREYVIGALLQALAEEPSADWAQMPGGAFARDWESDEDRVYDRLS